MPSFVWCKTEIFQSVEIKCCIIYAIILYGAISVCSMIYNEKEKQGPRMDVFSSFFFYSIQFLLNRLLDMTWFCIMPDQCRLVHSFPVFILISSGKPNWYPESFVDSTCEIQEENPKQRLMVCLSNAFLLFHFLQFFLTLFRNRLHVHLLRLCNFFRMFSSCWRIQMNSNHFHCMVLFCLYIQRP